MERLYSGFSETAEKYGTTYEAVRHMARRLRVGTVKPGKSDTAPAPAVEEPAENKTSTFKENFETGEANLSFTTSSRIKTKEDLVASGMLDLDDFEILSYEVGTWEGYRKDKKANLTWTDGVMNGYVDDSGNLKIETLYRVNVKLKRRTLDNDLAKQKDLILEELKEYATVKRPSKLKAQYEALSKQFDDSKRNCALEINIPDLHVGKLAWGAEAGEDYDISIASSRFRDSLAELVSRTNLSILERFIFVVGNDMINVDGKNNMTTAGTPQSSDTRYYKMVQVARKLLIDAIDDLLTIAPVDVVVVPGNHDSNTMLLIGDILDAFYHTNSLVNVFNTPASRKYYQYGEMGLMYAHGHNEKLNQLPTIFAAENKTLWFHARWHRIHVGHFHHSKQITQTDIQETPGCVTKIINSLSSNDQWHADKAYLSLKGAEAFLYHKEKGMIANYQYYV